MPNMYQRKVCTAYSKDRVYQSEARQKATSAKKGEGGRRSQNDRMQNANSSGGHGIIGGKAKAALLLG